MDDQIPISAILLKKGSKVGLLHKRLCEFSKNTNQLIIYKNIKKSKVERIIDITADTIVTKKDIPANKNSFLLTLIHPDKTTTFLTQKQNLRDDFYDTLRKAALTTNGLTMNCFDIISVLGRGYFGKVMLCRRKNTNYLFAIKSIKKKLLQEEEKLNSVNIEREILRKCNNPFITKISFAFDTETKLYLGLEFVNGGNLQHHLKEENQKLPLHDIKLYLAEIAIALNYLHQNGIIYRDLKSANILLDHEGHIKLADFGLSILFDDPSTNNTTHSFVGTPECIPPEMIQRIPYSYEADWWQYGILAYELLFKDKPFKHPNSCKLFELICTANVIFPFDRSKFSKAPALVHSKSLTQDSLHKKSHHSKRSKTNFNRSSASIRSVKSLPVSNKNHERSPKKHEIPINSNEISEEEITFLFITSLLEKDPKKRMTFEELKNHPFFAGINFNDVLEKKIKPTYIPPANKLNIDENIREECPADSYASMGSDIPSNIFDDFSFVDNNYEQIDEENIKLIECLANSDDLAPTQFETM